MKNDPIVTIGIPVYNGERVVEERIKQILNQTFQDFIIVISDNNSSDNTSHICKEVSRDDERIIFFQQEENRGPYWNTNFVLSKSKTKFFVWAFVDDLWEENFLEENVKILEDNSKIVGSIGDVKEFNRIINEDDGKIEIQVIENLKKFQYVHPISGKLEDKIKFYLDYNYSTVIYAVFRTEILKHANVFEEFMNPLRWRADFAYVLNIIKEGDLHVTTNNIVYKEVTKTSTSIIQYLRKSEYGVFDILLYNFPFTIWCAKNLGSRIFLKNFGYFVKLNIISGGGLIAEILRMCKRILSGKERYW